MRQQLSLNGVWDWYIPGGQRQKREVPSSYMCVGEAYYERTLELAPEKGNLIPQELNLLCKFKNFFEYQLKNNKDENNKS